MSRFARRLQQSIILPIPSLGWPDASNTGHSGTLPAQGPTTLSTAGAVFENKRVNGRLTVTAANVTIRNVHVDAGGDYYGILVSGSNATIEDATVQGALTAGVATSSSGSYTARRLNVHSCEDGVRLSNNCKLYDSYVHDLVGDANSHFDSVTADGFTGWEIVHNRIYNQFNQTACVWIGDPRFDPSEGLLQNNFFAGGGYSIYGGHSTGQGLRVLDNVFSTLYYPDCGYYGPVTYWQSANNTWSNNRWYDGPNVGQLITP